MICIYCLGVPRQQRIELRLGGEEQETDSDDEMVVEKEDT